jgi:hypothetical protein
VLRLEQALQSAKIGTEHWNQRMAFDDHSYENGDASRRLNKIVHW